ncbi:MAG: hypothetical protein ACREO5_06775, partial [Candidatus Binatia bacterium]
IAEISGKTSQSAILKTLTDHCSGLAGRGAFFIIKNDKFVGWQVFGKDLDTNESTARDIHFSVSADTILAKSVQDLQTVVATSGSHKDDTKFLKSLKFGNPEHRYAVPLIARGRGVAVLYADGGVDGVPVHIDAIEALVRVAGLTVELLASSSSARPVTESTVEPTSVAEVYEYDPEQEMPEPEALAAKDPVVEDVATEELVVEEPVIEEAHFADSAEMPEVSEVEGSYVEELTDTVPVVVDESLDDESYLMSDPNAHVIEAEAITSLQDVPEVIEEPTDSATGFALVDIEPEHVEEHPETAVMDEEPVEVSAGNDGHEMIEPAVETNGAAPTNGRKRRGVDLPIEVSDDEREKHKKARSFARLLVSEIKLYNPDKVNDGKQAKDLYERLREAIDRSREMYQQRVDEPVSTRFDYFHYELVNGLAEGDESRLGSSYPGSHAQHAPQ